MLKRLVMRHKKSSAICCVSLCPQGVSIAVISPTQQMITSSAFLPANDEGAAIKALSRFIDHHHLQGAQCHYILQPSQYRLLYLDAPPVLDAELRQSARWLIKDLIQYPLEQAAVDVFPVPTRSEQKKMYVVVSRVSDIQNILKLMQRVQLDVVNVTILEFSLEALLRQQSNGQCSTLLYSDEQNTHLLIAKAGQICLVRDIGDGYHLMSEGYDRFALEIQRSLDFYQSQFGEVPSARVYVTPGIQQNTGLLSYLAHNLALLVEPLVLPNGLVGSATEYLDQYLPTIGFAKWLTTQEEASS